MLNTWIIKYCCAGASVSPVPVQGQGDHIKTYELRTQNSELRNFEPNYGCRYH